MLEIVRICKKCNQTKLLIEFSKRKNGKDGYRYECKSCHNVENRNQRKQKPEQYRKYDFTRKEKPERQTWKKRYSKTRYWANREILLVKNKEWRIKHPEYMKESLNKLAEWNKKHPENAKKISRKFWLNNIERLKVEHKIYQKTHQEEFKKYGQKYRKNNYERYRELARKQFKIYYQKNKNRFLEYNRQRKARKLSVLSIHFTVNELDQRLSMFGYNCWICGKPYEAVDHVKPLIVGGSHILANLRPICTSCNSKKGIIWPYSKIIALQKMAA